MIGSIRGRITLKTERFIIVEVAGVGYKISISSDTLSKIQKTNHEVCLFTHTHVREDTLDLYGFLDYVELEFFEMLISISGIGPKGALTILSVANVSTLKKAIKSGDTGYLTKISGVGRKTAEKMVIELRDKIGKEMGGSSNEDMREALDALEALKALGYSQGDAREALKEVDSDLDTNKKIKEALKILGSK
jgi:Holliday junction DNA helicase RuvA